MEKNWLKHYPAGVPAQISTDQYPSLVALLDAAFAKHRELAAYKFMGRSFSFGDLDELSRAFAAYLQSLRLERGDRVAIMMPNVPQYPVAVAAVLRAGYVVVNVNPLYTPRELEHQLKDSGAKVVVLFENFAYTLQQVYDNVPTRQVVLVAMGDMLGLIKGTIVNHVVRKVRKLVPAYELPGARRFNDVVAAGRGLSYLAPRIGPEDIAVLQYTGGTTGVSKGAVLLHRNLVANLLQAEAWNQPALKKIAQRRAAYDGVRAAAVSHLRFHREHDAVDAYRRLQHPDSEPARHPGGAEGTVHAAFSQLPGGEHAVQRARQPSGLQHRRLEPPGAVGRRRHGGAAGHGQAVAGKDRLLDLRRLRPVRNQPVGDLQPGRQHRLQRQHRPAAAEHRDRAARR